MQNAKNEWNDKKNEFTDKIGEKKNEWSDKADKAIAQVKNINPEDVRKTAREIGAKVRDVSSDLYDGTVSTVRTYPVYTALGLAAVGFLAGYLFAPRKSA